MDKLAAISDDRVRERTGKGWAAWLRLLDRAGAKAWPHREIAAWLREHHPELSGWWCQMIAVGYEQARGLREAYESERGYQVSKSKTLPVSVEELFRAWADARRRRHWLPEKLVVTRATPARSLRARWGDGKTRLDVNFYAKGEAKSQVTVQHSRLATAAEAAAQKRFWGKRFEALAAYLAGR